MSVSVVGSGALRYFKDGEWRDVGEPPETQVVATGGTVTDIVDDGLDYRLHTFITSDDFVVTAAGRVEYVIVAGGGATVFVGSVNNSAGGGGGAGGVLVGEAAVAVGTVAVVIGAGGVNASNIAGDGQNSYFGDIGSMGGGAGYLTGNGRRPMSGGSASGAFRNETTAGNFVPGQGNVGGLGDTTAGLASQRGAGGGGGAAAAGGNGAPLVGGNGGDGRDISTFLGQSPTTTYVGGGGGGGVANTTATGGLGGLGGGGNGAIAVAAENGAANTGGGAGGASGSSATNAVGADGGSGVVYVRYRLL